MSRKTAGKSFLYDAMIELLCFAASVVNVNLKGVSLKVGYSLRSNVSICNICCFCDDIKWASDNVLYLMWLVLMLQMLVCDNVSYVIKCFVMCMLMCL